MGVIYFSKYDSNEIFNSFIHTMDTSRMSSFHTGTQINRTPNTYCRLFNENNYQFNLKHKPNIQPLLII